MRPLIRLSMLYLAVSVVLLGIMLKDRILTGRWFFSSVAVLPLGAAMLCSILDTAIRQFRQRP